MLRMGGDVLCLGKKGSGHKYLIVGFGVGLRTGSPNPAFVRGFDVFSALWRSAFFHLVSYTLVL